MKDYDAAAVLEVIEQLVAELGLEAVPAEIDVDGAVQLLNEEIYGDKVNGSEEEGTAHQMEVDEEPMVCPVEDEAHA